MNQPPTPYLTTWTDRNRELYEGLVTDRKREAALQLLPYGAPHCPGLRDVARAAGVSLGTLRVWRTEGPFQRLSRQIVWDCADAFVEELIRSGTREARSLAPQLASFAGMGTALQHAVLWRVVGDRVRLCRTWPPFLARLDMVGELLELALPRPPARDAVDKALVPHLQAFVWQALPALHSSRAATVAQRHRHLAIITFVGLLMADAAYRALAAARGNPGQGIPFLEDGDTLRSLEATFAGFYTQRARNSRRA